LPNARTCSNIADDGHIFTRTPRLSWSLSRQPAEPTSQGHAFVAADRVRDRSACGPKWLQEAAIADLIAGTIQIGEHERHFYEQHEKRIYSLGARASVLAR